MFELKIILASSDGIFLNLELVTQISFERNSSFASSWIYYQLNFHYRNAFLYIYWSYGLLNCGFWKNLFIKYSIFIVMSNFMRGYFRSPLKTLLLILYLVYWKNLKISRSHFLKDLYNQRLQMNFYPSFFNFLFYLLLDLYFYCSYFSQV